ncbi:MAG: hypothetical protein M3112_03090 [Actinomycetia bacterium]|nr:hypothetical protein [Actinomycetes bacterium]
MIARRTFNALPGPRPVQIVLAAALLVVAFVALLYVYDWMGNFLDSGGAIS